MDVDLHSTQNLWKAVQCSPGHQRAPAFTDRFKTLRTRNRRGGGVGVAVLSFVHCVTPPKVRAERDWVENLSGPILPVR